MGYHSTTFSENISGFCSCKKFFERNFGKSENFQNSHTCKFLKFSYNEYESQKIDEYNYFSINSLILGSYAFTFQLENSVICEICSYYELLANFCNRI